MKGKSETLTREGSQSNDKLAMQTQILSYENLSSNHLQSE